MDIEMFGKLSDAFGPSGFEEDVIRTIADYCKEFDVENDAMNNLYVRMPGTKQDSRPVIQLDAHLDACGFMVQNIQDNGSWHYHAWRLSSDQPSGTCGMDPHQIRKDGTWYYLRKTGSFHDNSGTQQSDSGN